MSTGCPQSYPQGVFLPLFWGFLPLFAPMPKNAFSYPIYSLFSAWGRNELPTAAYRHARTAVSISPPHSAPSGQAIPPQHPVFCPKKIFFIFFKFFFILAPFCPFCLFGEGDTHFAPFRTRVPVVDPLPHRTTTTTEPTAIPPIVHYYPTPNAPMTT